MAQVRSGNADALARLFDRHGDPLYRYLYGLTGRRELAEDLLQDTFLRLWRFGPRLPPEVHISYVYRIAMNLVRDELRRPEERPGLPDEFGRQESSGASFEEQLAVRDILTRALQVLSIDQQMAVGLHYFADQSVDAVARITGVAPGTVKSRLHRAYRRLADRLRELEDGHA
jgi:RNA polymerase sigma-70 factor (ECF subfamily)